MKIFAVNYLTFGPCEYVYFHIIVIYPCLSKQKTLTANFMSAKIVFSNDTFGVAFSFFSLCKMQMHT